jgi:plasmid stabilization system protein ParE
MLDGTSQYRVVSSDPPQIVILRVLHGAMLWPPQEDRTP